MWNSTIVAIRIMMLKLKLKRQETREIEIETIDLRKYHQSSGAMCNAQHFTGISIAYTYN